ncbi:MAG: hypothetical protein P4L84_12460 [Isosphaeraceae bacterium]|nr:hypothetical protein [Isosphaeraceae bacterium]
MPHGLVNKYRAAIELLQRGRDSMVEDLADEIIDQGDELRVGAYTFNELLETQGTRLHFLGLLISQLELSAEAFEETQPPPPPTPKAPARRRRAPAKKMQQTSKEGSTEDA